MQSNPPYVVILAGPNGAGKSTSAPLLLRDTLAVDEFVNADVIASGLSAFAPERAALAAGKIMLRRLRELADQRRNFAFETTLASRSFAPWLAHLTATGYKSHLLFLALPNVELAIQRVAMRVSFGGHAIPEEVIRRRYDAGLRNLLRLYVPLVTTWTLFVNSSPFSPEDVAEGYNGDVQVYNERLYKIIKEGYDKN
ncbi:MAG: zeta toxin family protein [Planctomycetes bacterium]|nr:zeta toxin family protein [Planctomycetota bacterium]